MNLLEGTCWMEDYMPPKEKIEAIDTASSHWTRLFFDIQKREKRLQEMANELIQAGWECVPPRGRL